MDRAERDLGLGASTPEGSNRDAHALDTSKEVWPMSLVLIAAHESFVAESVRAQVQLRRQAPAVGGDDRRSGAFVPGGATLSRALALVGAMAAGGQPVAPYRR